MSWRSSSVALMALTLLACGEGPTDVSENAPVPGEMIITQGAAAPAPSPRGLGPVLSAAAAAAATVGGSATTPLSLTPQTCSETATQTIVITYTITGNQVGTATFDVNTAWSYNGSAWSGSAPTTVTVPPRAPTAAPTVRTVTLTVTNASTVGSGTSTISIVPSNLTNTNSMGAKLSFDSESNTTVFVAFTPCAHVNTPPTLVVPDDMTVEATSSAGALVNYLVTASDLEDGDLTASVTCTPASGSQFSLGTTTVNCSVTDNDGAETTASFTITVEDTTPAFFTNFPSGTIIIIAVDLDGATLDLDGLGITVEDVGHVSEPSTFDCDYVAGTVLEIGSTTTVSCTASDALGNESAPSTFDVFVGLNVAAGGFMPPLRMTAPFSAHKRGSTIPHKFLPPTYADGTPATDLASGLRLVIRRLDGTPGVDDIVVNDYTAGSTEWRYADGQYVFNLKTGTSSPWDMGTWVTEVSYKGIVLASTQFELRR
jgi:HYR domain-containing protein